MVDAKRKYLILTTMGVALAAIVTLGIVRQVEVLFLLTAILSLLSGMIYVGVQFHTPRPKSKIFLVMLVTSLVFFAGALEGFLESIHDGWHWTDLLYLIFPVAMGSYILWFALRNMRNAAR